MQLILPKEDAIYGVINGIRTLKEPCKINVYSEAVYL
jgi:hypothetical protein